MPHDIALVISDVDGTLVDEDKVLSPRAQRVVRALGVRGIRFAVTSGRPPRGMKMLVEPLGLTTPIAGFNGGVFADPRTLVPMTEHSLPEAVARAAVARMQESGLDVWLYSDTAWLVRNPKAPHVAREAWTVKFPPRMATDFAAVDMATLIKIVGVSDDTNKMAASEAALQREFAGQASATRSQPYYLDVTNRLANKGEVVRTLATMLGIPPARIATIGDGPNDVMMFRESGFSIAMGNASAAVKRAASVVTTRHDEDGFARAMEKYLLEEP